MIRCIGLLVAPTVFGDGFDSYSAGVFALMISSSLVKFGYLHILISSCMGLAPTVVGDGFDSSSTDESIGLLFGMNLLL